MNALFWSDAALATACLLLAVARRRQGALLIAALIMGFAAACGVAVYAGVTAVEGPHRFGSLLAETVALPLLATWLAWPEAPIAAYRTGAFAFALILATLGIAAAADLSVYGQAVAAVMAAAMIAAGPRRGPLGFLAGTVIAAAVATASLPVLPTALRITLLHWLLAVGMILFIAIPTQNRMV